MKPTKMSYFLFNGTATGGTTVIGAAGSLAVSDAPTFWKSDAVGLVAMDQYQIPVKWEITNQSSTDSLRVCLVNRNQTILGTGPFGAVAGAGELLPYAVLLPGQSWSMDLRSPDQQIVTDFISDPNQIVLYASALAVQSTGVSTAFSGSVTCASAT